jgi:predicted metalloprotease with PDZ domain
VIDERYSVGIRAAQDGSIADVIQGSAAWHAGLGPLMRIAGINGQPWDAGTFRRAIANVGANALDLEIVNGAERMRVTIPGPLAASFPHLHRNKNPDLITAILVPRAM